MKQKISLFALLIFITQLQAGNPLSVAVVQQDGNLEKTEENWGKALNFAKEALAKKVDVISFHKGLLTGYVNNVIQIWNKEDIILNDIYPAQAQEIRQNNTRFQGFRPEL